MKPTAEQRFWAKVDTSGECWVWIGGKDRKGYGRFSMGSARKPDGTRRNSMVAAHRFSYELENGPIPDGPGFHGFCVLHRCDNPSCVLPKHLFLGTNEDNVHDMDSKGRRVNNQIKGSGHRNAVLNEEQVREIVAKHYGEGRTQKSLALEYGVCHATVNHIFTGRLWGHLGLIKTKHQRSNAA